MLDFGKLWRLVWMVLCLNSTPVMAAEMSLPQAIAATLKNNPAVSGKQAEVKAKQYASDAARAQRYPSLSMQAGVQKSDTEAVEQQDQKILMFRVRQPLWAFGRIDDGIEFADKDVLADKADFLRVKRELLDKTVSAYVRVLSMQAQVAVAKDNVHRHQQLYDRIKRREQGQLASAAEVGLAQIRLMQARAQAQKMEGDRKLQLNELAAITNFSVEGVKTVADGLLKLPNLPSVESQVLSSSADVRHKKQLIEVAKAKAEQESSSSMPTVYLQADKYLNQLGYRNGIQYSLMVEGNLDGMGFSTKGRVQAANARVTASQQTLEVAQEDLLRQTRNYYQQRQMQAGLVKMYANSVAQVREVIDSYIRQYDAGKKSWIEVLNMQKELTDQQLAEVQAQHDWLLNTLRLKVLLGQMDNLKRAQQGESSG